MSYPNFVLTRNFFVSSLLTLALLFSGMNAKAAEPVAVPSQQSTVPKLHKVTKFEKWLIEKITKKIQKRQAKIDRLMKEGKIAKAKKVTSNMKLGVILVVVGLLLIILAIAPASGALYTLGALSLVIGLVLFLIEYLNV